jgi:Na+/proline symporter
MPQLEIISLTAAAIQFTVFIIVILLCREKSTYRIYVSDPKRWGTAAIAIANTSTVIGGGMFFAITQIGFEAGVLGIYLGVIYLFGFAIFSMFCDQLTKKLKEHKVITFNQLIGKTYSRRVATLFSAVNALLYFGMLSAQFVAVKLFFVYLAPGANDWYILLPIAAFALNLFSYPIFGGLRRDIVGDLCQFAVIAIGSVIIGIALFKYGEVFSWKDRLQAAHWTGMSYGLDFVIVAILFITPTFFVRTDMWQRVGAAKSPRQAKIGFLIAGVLSFAAFVLFTMTGMAAYATGVKGLPQTAAIAYFSNFLHGPLMGIVLGTFLSAVLSTADTYVNNLAIHATSLFWPVEKDEKVALKRIRYASLGLVFAAGLFGYWVSDIVELFVASFSLLLIFFNPVFGIWSPKWRSELAAFGSILVSILAFFIACFIWSPKSAFVPASIISFVAYACIRQFEKSYLVKSVLQS